MLFCVGLHQQLFAVSPGRLKFPSPDYGGCTVTCRSEKRLGGRPVAQLRESAGWQCQSAVAGHASKAKQVGDQPPGR